MIKKGAFEVLPAKQSSVCSECRQDIHIGDPIIELCVRPFNKREEFYVWFHRDCTVDMGTDLEKAW